MQLILIAAFISFLVVSVGSAEPHVPSSARSSTVVARVEQRLKQELTDQGLRLGAPVFIRIFKQPGVLELWVEKGKSFQLFRSYKICAFSGTLGPKVKEGDRQAPEGCYLVTPDRMNPNSSYHLSFNLGFPNAFDQHHRRTGSALMVHGKCVSIGCYAMGDHSIEEIWTLCSRALKDRQKFFRVHCFPFPLTEKNIEQHQGNRWIDFWKDLRPIYDHFERDRIPPNVTVFAGRYTITLR